MREVFVACLVSIDRDPIRPLIVRVRARIARFIYDIAERVGSSGGGFALDVLLTTSRVHFVRVLAASSTPTATASQELYAHPFEHDDQDEHD